MECIHLLTDVILEAPAFTLLYCGNDLLSYAIDQLVLPAGLWEDLFPGLHFLQLQPHKRSRDNGCTYITSMYCPGTLLHLQAMVVPASSLAWLGCPAHAMQSMML